MDMDRGVERLASGGRRTWSLQIALERDAKAPDATTTTRHGLAGVWSHVVHPGDLLRSCRPWKKPVPEAGRKTHGVVGAVYCGWQRPGDPDDCEGASASGFAVVVFSGGGGGSARSRARTGRAAVATSDDYLSAVGGGALQVGVQFAPTSDVLSRPRRRVRPDWWWLQYSRRRVFRQ